jgi:hypothetical protein
MSIEVFLMILGAALVHAVWNALVKSHGDRLGLVKVMFVTQFAASDACSRSLLFLLVKTGHSCVRVRCCDGATIAHGLPSGWWKVSIRAPVMGRPRAMIRGCRINCFDPRPCDGATPCACRCRRADGGFDPRPCDGATGALRETASSPACFDPRPCEPYARVAAGPSRSAPKSEQAIRRAPAGLGEKGARTALPITLLAKKRSNQQDDRAIHQEVAQTGGLSCSA